MGSLYVNDKEVNESLEAQNINMSQCMQGKECSEAGELTGVGSGEGQKSMHAFLRHSKEI